MAQAIRTATRIQDQDDTNVTPGPGVDGYALTWDNGMSRFVLASVGGIGGAGVAGQVAYWSAVNAITGAATFTYQTGASPNLLVQAANAAHTPAVIRGAVGHTGNLFELQSSAPAILCQFRYDGSLDFAGYTTAIPHAIFIDRTRQPTGAENYQELRITSAISPGVNTTARFYAVNLSPSYGGTGNITDFYGLSLSGAITSSGRVTNTTGGYFSIANTGAGSAATVIGGSFLLSNNTAGGSLWDTAYGGKFYIDTGTNGRITTAYGCHISVANYGISITNLYGLYVANANTGTTLNYAIYTNLGLVRFGDALNIVGAVDRQQFLVTGFSTQAVATPLAQVTRADAAAGVSAMLGLTALGSGANGDGGAVYLRGKTSTTAAQEMARIAYLWNDATHASRKADLVFSVYDTAEREGIRIRGNGSEPALGFYGVAPVARQLLATGTGATVDNVISALQALGLLKQA